MANRQLVRSTIEDGGIAILTLDRRERLNALIPAIHSQLQGHVQQLEENDSIRALVITGAGRAFCAGGDLKEMAARGQRHLIHDRDSKEKARSAERKRLQHAHQTIRLLASSRLPFVAAINGAAAGAGLALALAADARLAVQEARLSVAFPHVGLSGDSGISILLPSVIGLRRARAALLEGAEWTAEEAIEIGLIDRIVSKTDLLSSAVERAQQLSAGALSAVGLIRSELLFPHALEAAFDRETEAMLICQETPAHIEAVEGFVARRTRSTNANS